MFPVLAFAYTRLAISEEHEVRVQFGPEYELYAAATPRFIPHIGRRRAPQAA
jgi:protein-S-isoprenylcysteine O-methyltransferase Ste14